MDKEKCTGCVTSAIARSHSCRLPHVVSSEVPNALAKIQHKGRNLWLTEKATTLRHIPEIL